MRRRIKKPMTPRIIRQKLALLQKVKDAGHDVNAWIDAATNGHWLDFYQPKELELTPRASSEADRTQAYLDSQKPQECTPERRAEVSAMLANVRANIRRVA
jgi:hypothetical protein